MGIDTFEIEHAFRQESGRAIASLVRVFGDIDITERKLLQQRREALSKRNETDVDAGSLRNDGEFTPPTP